MAKFRIVVAGGGIAGLEAILALRGLAGRRIDLTLVCPGEEFSLRALEVAEPFREDPTLTLSIETVLSGLDVQRIEDTVIRVAPESREVVLPGGGALGYDGLLLAVGGVPFPAYAHGITFDRPRDPEAFDELLADVDGGLASDVAFVVPDAQGWTLPAYELAFLLRGWARRRRIDVGIRVVTAEDAPLQMFGATAAAEVDAALGRAEIMLVAGSSSVVFSDTALVAGGHWVSADRIVSMPRLAGPRLAGVPSDWEGFIEVDDDGAVPGCAATYAVGDGAAHAQKQGGLAAQQADRAARLLLADAGINVPALDGPPILRGVLATPEGPLFLQSAAAWGAPGTGSLASYTPLWHPPSKVVTRWLGPHLDELVRRRHGAFAA